MNLARIFTAKGQPANAYPPIQAFIQSRPNHIGALLLVIRVAHELGISRVVGQGLLRLAGLAGGAPLAMVEQIAMLTEQSGPLKAIEAAEESGLDFTLPANAAALRALLDQQAAVSGSDVAWERISSALEQHPEAAVFHDIAARVLQSNDGDPAEVRAHFASALDLDPEHASALSGMAGLMAAGGAVDDAIAMYEQAFAADPAFLEASNGAITLLFEKGRAAEAERLLADRVLRDPRDAVSANALANSLAERGGDLDRALSYARRAAYFELAEDASETLGWIHLLRAEHAEAVAVLLAAVETRPEAMRARYRLGLALAANGDQPAAREAFGAVIDANAPEAERARLEIARLGDENRGE